MAQVKLLKIAADGVPVENAATDDVTFGSFTVNGGGPVMGATGIDMNGQDVTDLSDLVFTDPAVGTVNQTAGALIANNIMGKDRENLMTTAGAVSFPVITDTAGQVDAFRLPALAGVPSATPTTGGAGHLVYDSTDGKLYAWTGSVWDDLSTVDSAQSLDNVFTADGAIAARDVVYISAADKVAPASASAAVSAQAIGFATASASDTASVNIRSDGILAGFTGLTAGARYFLSTSAGAVTATIPSGTGNTVVQCGYAKSTTAMMIQIQSLGRRA